MGEGMADRGAAFAELARQLAAAGLEALRDADVRPFLTFRIGGRVRLLAVISDRGALRLALRAAAGLGLPVVMLGGGSNTVFAAPITEALVVVNRAGRIRAAGPGLVWAEAGARNAALLSWCVARQAAGLEFLAGIPGSIGGAVAVNAGAMGLQVGDRVRRAVLLDEAGRERRVGPARFGFAYRTSRLKLGGEAILAVGLAVEPGDGREVARRIAAHAALRSERHPSYQEASAGCFFKNPEINGRKESAGRLVEACNLKGRRWGGIQVSEAHANFLLNRGEATFADLQAGEAEIRLRVRELHGIELQREVVYVGGDGRKF